MHVVDNLVILVKLTTAVGMGGSWRREPGRHGSASLAIGIIRGACEIGKMVGWVWAGKINAG